MLRSGPACKALLLASMLVSGMGLTVSSVSGQTKGSTTVIRSVVVDDQGVLRWKDTGEEAAFFGVNYMAPFAYSYRALGYVGASCEEAIHADVVHMARMGVNAVRVHVQDSEVSDRTGNLVANDHLRLLDYLIAQCRARGIYVLLTPINWGGNGYPETDPPSQGFSPQYPKREMGVNPAAVQASARFLGQFVRHVNPETGLAYKDDPAILGFELVNEPWAPPIEKLKGYVEALAAGVRETGSRKPLIYNASQGGWKKQSEVLQESSVEGVSFGWYPSGLVSGRTLTGNFLPTLDSYPMLSDPAFAQKLKTIYEFDAADIAGSYMYPAFARMFRANGIQWATQFIYCPLPLAESNTPYQTHYLNLITTPGKAVSMLIAAEAFRRLPRYGSYGTYPENARFDAFQVSYKQDRSEMVTEQSFLYSNDTDTAPPKPEQLNRVAGCGSSPVVRYEGTGCYFLEKLKDGAWRLEVYPDAVSVNDPHGAPRLDREVTRILWQIWPMEVRLPDLGSDFTVKGVNPGNTRAVPSRAGRFAIRPGIYTLQRRGVTAPAITSAKFIAPKGKQAAAVVVPSPHAEIEAGKQFTLSATIASAPLPDEVTLNLRAAGTEIFHSVPMRRIHGYLYVAEIPQEILRPGKIEYTIRVQGGSVGSRVFPSGATGQSSSATNLWQNGALIPASKSTKQELLPPSAILIRGRTNSPEVTGVHITFTTKDGVRSRCYVPLTTEMQTHRIPYSALKAEKGWIVLRPPTAQTLTSIQFAATPDMPPGNAVPAGIEIESISTGPEREWWEGEVRAKGAAPVLFDAVRDFPRLLTAYPFGASARTALSREQGAAKASLLIEATALKPAQRIAARHTLEALGEKATLPGFDSLLVRVRVRPGVPENTTIPFRVALLDEDGNAWETEVSAAAQWNNLLIPLSALQPAEVVRVPIAYPGNVTEAVTAHKETNGTAVAVRLEKVEAIQFTLTGPPEGQARGIEIESLTLAASGGK